MLVCLGDSITADPGAWPEHVPVETVNLAKHGARLPDLLDQLDRAPAGPAAVVSIGTNHIVQPSGPLDFESDLAAVAAGLRRYERAVVLPVLHRAGGGGPYRAEFQRRHAVFWDALVASGLDVLPFRLRRWHWQGDNMHPTVRGQRYIAGQVQRWLET